MDKKIICFFGLESHFSNFHPAIFEYKENKFISNEHFMMYAKARNFNDEMSARKIMEINNNPLAKDFLDGVITSSQIISDRKLSEEWKVMMMSVKQAGRKVIGFDEKVWSAKREVVVRFGAKLKFEQNPLLMEELLKTDGFRLVEASKFDKIWGAGLWENELLRTAEVDWPGMNLLGKILEEVRSKFSLERKEIEVINFYKMGKNIPADGVYIGRESKQNNLSGSLFANPFAMKTGGDDIERDRVIASYEGWIKDEIQGGRIRKEDLLALRGKKLVCYCSPKKCHGDIIKNLVNLLISDENEFINLIGNKSIKMRI